jgi:hypothetical protein
MDNGVAESKVVWRRTKERRLGQTVSVGEKWVASWVAAKEDQVGNSNEVNWVGGVEAMSMEEEEKEPEENIIPIADKLTVPPEASEYGNYGV